MIHHRATAFICLLAFAPGLALGQSQDPAAERARLGNERIEAERRAREELEQPDQAPESAGQPAAAPTDPRGRRIDWPRLDDGALVALLADERPAVVERAIDMVARRGGAVCAAGAVCGGRRAHPAALRPLCRRR
jgi:hypothetical protein